MATDLSQDWADRESLDKSSTIATMDFDSHFGRIVDVFFQRRDQIANDMWTHQLRELAGSESTLAFWFVSLIAQSS